MKSGLTLLTVVATMLLAVIGLGCNEDAPRSRILITRIAETATEQYYNDYVFISDVVSSAGTVFEDQVFVTVENQPRSDLLTIKPEGPYGAVVLTGYRIDYEVEGEHIEPIEAGMHLTIPSGQTGMVRIVIVTAYSKTQPPLSTLATEPDEIMATAHITLTGYEETSEEEVTAKVAMQVHFANWADS